MKGGNDESFSKKSGSAVEKLVQDKALKEGENTGNKSEADKDSLIQKAINQGHKNQGAGNNAEVDINEIFVTDPKRCRTEKTNTYGPREVINQEEDIMDSQKSEIIDQKNLLLGGAVR